MAQSFRSEKSNLDLYLDRLWERMALLTGRTAWNRQEWLTWLVTIPGPILLVIGAVMLWIHSLSSVDLSRMNDLGLGSVLPFSAYAAIVLLIISFSLVVHRRRSPDLILYLHVLALIGMIHATPNILYGTLRYAWAWKHVGIVDYIQRHGSVDPNILYLNAYHNWPGFFALNALLTEVAGFTSALSYAGWAPVFFNLLDLGGLLLIMKTATSDRRLLWLSIWFFYLANWIGQDYFSPQALGYFLYLVIVGICLRWFQTTSPLSKATLKRWLLFDKIIELYDGLTGTASGSHSSPAETPARPLQRLGLLTIISLALLTVATTHQLTPFVLIGALTGLVVFQRCHVRTLPILAAVLTATWIMYMATPFLKHGNIVWVIQSLGHLWGNIGSNLIDLSLASPGQKFVAFMSRGLTILVGGLGLLGGLRRLRQGYWDLAFILLAMTPFPLIAGNSYGGEMVFRIYFFALPFMAFFAAALVYPGPTAGTSWRTVVLTVLLSGVLFVGFLFAYYGKERMFYFTQNEVDAAEYLYNTAPDGSLLVDGTINYPWGFKNYEYFDYTSLSYLSETEQAELLADPAAMVSDIMTNANNPTAYLIITRSQKANIEMLGLMPPGSLGRVEQALMQSPKFKLIYSNHDAKIFTLARDFNGVSS